MLIDSDYTFTPDPLLKSLNRTRSARRDPRLPGQNIVSAVAGLYRAINIRGGISSAFFRVGASLSSDYSLQIQPTFQLTRDYTITNRTHTLALNAKVLSRSLFNHPIPSDPLLPYRWFGKTIAITRCLVWNESWVLAIRFTFSFGRSWALRSQRTVPVEPNVPMRRSAVSEQYRDMNCFEILYVQEY
ncbi:unnamed protein product [Nezara viridula]|uniref:Uncharacterized protein n=1 Tax=Nezara viridula TaxID=85310 RepID=A0A9P0MV04_NEZVI|nr:unnamed protein product [Nezara viridula]